MQILAVSGSLRADSTNTRLLRAAMQLTPPDVEIRLTSQVARLPLFNPDLDARAIESVARWIQEVRWADGIVISTPEYARGYPGSLKNAFDWLVDTDAHVDKPFMLLSATSRSTIAQDTFTRVLETMSGVHVAGASTIVPLLGTKLDIPDIVGNPEFAKQIREAVGIFAVELRRRAMVAAGGLSG